MNQIRKDMLSDPELIARRRAAGYELRQSANGEHLVFRDLRRANRPPDAPIPTLASWSGERLEKVVEQFRAEVETRLRLEREAAAREDTMSILIDELQAAQRTKRLLMWIGGGALAVETLALAGLIWRMLP